MALALQIAVVTVFLVLGVVWGAVALGSQLDGVNEGQTADPLEVFFGVLRGKVVWPASATWIVAVLGGAVLALGILVAVAAARSRGRRSPVSSTFSRPRQHRRAAWSAATPRHHRHQPP